MYKKVYYCIYFIFLPMHPDPGSELRIRIHNPNLKRQCHEICDFGPHIREVLATFQWNIYRKNIHRQIVLHYRYILNFHTHNMGVNKRSFLVQNQRIRRRRSSRTRNHIQKGFNPCIRGLWGVI
jgi:hypothetical protein